VGGPLRGPQSGGGSPEGEPKRCAAGVGHPQATGSVNFFKKNYFQTFKMAPTAVLAATTTGVQTRYPQKGEKSCNAMVVNNQEV
jgi:hypothetical protein